jgi:hypothetical protein
MSPLTRTRLHAEPDLRVLWLCAGKSELALSEQGLWLRRGRREAELVWREIRQVQAVAGSVAGQGALRVEIFRRDGGAHVLGPFDRPPAERWLEACGEAAAEHGERPLPLQGAMGFALGD